MEHEIIKYLFTILKHILNLALLAVKVPRTRRGGKLNRTLGQLDAGTLKNSWEHILKNMQKGAKGNKINIKFIKEGG